MGKIVSEDFNGGNGYYKINLAYLNKDQVEEVESLVSTWNPTDEDIKSCIRMCLTDADEQRFKDYGTNLKDCLAWLAKQKEPLPIPDKFSGLKSLMLQYLQSAANRKDDTEIERDTDLWGRKILDYVWKYSDEQKEQKPLKVGENAYFDPNTDMWFIKKEQKPAEKQDYSGLNDLERAIHRGFLAAGIENVPVTIIKETAKECLAQMKPAEWSDEDEDMLNSCISSIEEAKENRYAYKETDGDTSYDHEIAWLKLLRNRVGKEFLQPHWKPSENIDIYEVAYERYPINNRLVREVTKDINEDTRDGFIDGYKYCDSTRWKPSEEQMKALCSKLPVVKGSGDKVQDILETLYYDLKKRGVKEEPDC